MARVISIYIGAPENDQKVSVSTDQTVSAIFKKHNVTMSGIVQHGQRALRPADYAKTLDELNVCDNDTLHIVKKLDGARG